MENIIAVFGNRSHTMSFASNLRRFGAKNSVIDTPRELSVSCGISVIFYKKNIEQARYIISNSNYSSFVGLFLVYTEGHLKKYRRL